jgi:peptide/nickel transport system substrate-binding protein
MHTPSRLFKPFALMAAVAILVSACSTAPAAPAAPAAEQPAAPAAEAPAAEAPAATEAPAAEAPAATEAPAAEAPAAEAPAAPTSFTEAPMLADLAKAGTVPALADRLPKVPFVVGPGVLVAEKDLPDWQPGKYGGTLRTAHSVADWAPDVFVMVNEPLLISPGIGTDSIRGNVLESFTVSDDGKTITFKMREGLKWSDGQPVTTEDIRFTYEDILKNETLTQNFPARWKVGASPDGAEPTVKVVDDFTFEVAYPEPYGGLLRQFTIESWVGYTEWLNPAHYLKQFHEKYADKDALAKALEEAKLDADEWNALFNQKRCLNWDVTRPRCIDYPVLNPWVLKSGDNNQLVFERNPYYFKVDTQGQQLPYIDKIVSTQVEDVEAVNLKVLAGEIDFLRESTALVKVPLYKENEEKAGFNTVLLDMHVDSSALFLNQTFTNTAQSADWTKYSQDVRFRKALSMAINRPEIIETIYFGYASLPLRDVGEEASKYDPDAANALLDEIGLTNKNADGLRLGSDGQPLTLLLEHGAHAPDIAPVAEIVGEDLKKVGINVLVKKIDPQLWDTRRGSNDLMSTLFWTHDQGWGGGVGMNEVLENGAGRAWWQYNNSQGELGEKPPDWLQQGFDLKKQWWSAVPGSDEWNKITEDSAAWQRDNLPIIKIVEGVKYPMIASKNLGNVAQGGYAIASNFSGEQLFFK